MIEYIKKDITSVERGVIGHGCNCQGRMGSGVALAIRNKWPQVYEQYIVLCKDNSDKRKLLGTIQAIPVVVELVVVNLFTQLNYGFDGQKYANIHAISKSLDTMFGFVSAVKLPAYIPRIGCGLGGLDWEQDVKPEVERLVEKHQINLYVCDL